MSDWKALVGRVTLFPTLPSPTVSALALFKEIWGGDPDSFQRQNNPLLPTTAQGHQGSVIASCSVHPTRIDLSLEPTLGGKPEVAVIENTSDLQRELLKIIKSVGNGVTSNTMARVAVFLQFIRICDTIVEANKVLSGVIPRKYGLNVTDEEDLVFQINRVRPSMRVPEVDLNSLTKWSVERIQVFALPQPTPGTPLQPISTGLQNATVFIAASVTFDNSSVAQLLQQPQKVHAFESGQQAALLIDALARASELQKEIGLDIEGF